ncbi:MAG: SpoIIE family protein phosphatase [Planctomycetia bacterium]|nr:SpoIIE family protein phosphatase [Planctomycetia bacterium]
MRRIFQKWLFVFVAVVFCAGFCISFCLQTRQAKNNAAQLIRNKIGDVIKMLNENQKDLMTIRENLASTALAKVRAFAKMIELDPSIITSEEQLAEIVKELCVDELHVSDENGILVASYPKRSEYYHYDMSSQLQSAIFMKAINDPDFELVQDVQRSGAVQELFQYAGVTRKDSPGIVQIGYKPERLQEAIKLADIRNLASGFRIGNNGKILICHNDEIVSIPDPSKADISLIEYGIDPKWLEGTEGQFLATIDEMQKLCLFEKHNIKDQGKQIDYTIIGSIPESEMYIYRDSSALELIIYNILLFLIVFILVSELVQKIVINGIYKVNFSLKKITEGNLTETVAVFTNDEFRLLSEGINKMVDSLKQLITEAAARIDKELEFARAIQLSSLPNIFPPFPDRKEFDIYATMHTAKWVGGDFYDFFLVDDDHLAVIVADVSGKGIPAALFMMTSKTLIKNLAITGIEPSEIFTQTNRFLSEKNDATMFVTAFIGILEISSGIFKTVSAGHNPPLMKKANGQYEWFHSKGGFVLAGLEGTKYQQSEIKLEKGDRLYLYTDGVTEALNTKMELYGEERLQLLLNKKTEDNISLQELLDSIKTDIDRFTQGAVQSDDITMLGFDYKGNE